MPYRDVVGYHNFEGSNCLHLFRVKNGNQMEATKSSKMVYPVTSLQGVTTQKTIT
jgi:hypothetical protein